MTVFDTVSTEEWNDVTRHSFTFKNRKFLFPQSYLEFSSKLGYGLFCELFIIYPPFTPLNDTDCDSFEERMSTIRGFIESAVYDDYLDFYPDGSDELVQHLIPFGASENGEYLCWDSRNFVENEYPIYIIGSRMASITLGAQNLYEFTEKCITSEIKSLLGLSYEPLPLSFKQFNCGE